MNNLDVKRIENMKVGMFNNKSYFGKRSSELKSGVCKYFRRGEIEKFEWCIIEMMILGLRNKGLMTNIINRLKILMFEEIGIGNVVCIEKMIELLNLVDQKEDWDEKVKILLEFIDLCTECRRGRICCYMNCWWNNNSEKYNLGKVVKNKIKKYQKKGDSEELLILGELLIEFIENKDERIIDIYNKMYNLEEKMGTRYRRKDAVYLFWTVVEDLFNNNQIFMNIIKFAREMFNRKNMHERKYYGIWIGMFVLNYDKLNWRKDLIYKKREINLEDYFSKRENIEMDKYVVQDFHVNKKYTIKDFAIHGALVVDEDLSDLKYGKKYKEFYIAKLLEK
tara:strand:- start:328 stop:1335 length:1008 start_codon:yes stop_codon:yes gene_type:complete